MTRWFVPLCSSASFVAFAMLSGPGCTKLTRPQESDRRTQATTALPPAESPAPSTGPDPSTTPAPSPAPPTTNLPAPSGVYELTEVHCPGRVVEAAKLKLRLVNQASGAYFERRDAQSGEDCAAHQPATLTMTDVAMTMKLGTTACEGACVGACPDKLLGADGSTITAPYTPVSGGFSLTLPDVKLAGHCTEGVPESLAFTRTGDGECAKLWHGNGALGTHQLLVLDGQLRWSANSLPKASTYNLVGSELSDDFTVAADLAGFEAGGKGAFFRLRLADKNDASKQLFAQFGVNSSGTPQLSAAIVPGVTYDPILHGKTVSRSTHEGTLIISKKGQDFSVKASAGTQTAERTFAAAGLGTGPYEITLELGNESTTLDLTLPSAVSIDAVTALNGAGRAIKPNDLFDCDSITP